MYLYLLYIMINSNKENYIHKIYLFFLEFTNNFYIYIYIYMSIFQNEIYKKKYLKYKNKYLSQKGGARFKVLVQRVGLEEDNIFDIVLWDESSPVYLRSDITTPPRDGGYVTWSMFKLVGGLPQSLQYPKMWEVQLEQVPEVAEYIKKNESTHLELMKRAFSLAMENKHFVHTNSKNPDTNKLFFSDELATDHHFAKKLTL